MGRKGLILGGAITVFALVLLWSGGKDTFINAIALAGLMVVFWLSEAIPIYVTAILPLVFGIPLGVLSDSQLASAYGDKNVFLFLGGFILALSLEKWDVHKQVARLIIQTIGFSKPRIILGFMLSTALLSMWISNTATTLMMLPMALAVLAVLPGETSTNKFSLFLLLSIAYSASIGGMATLVGSPPNIQMAGILESNFSVEVDFQTWMKFGLPMTVLMLIIAYGFFYLLLGKERKDRADDIDFSPQPWTRDQKKVLLVFTGVVLLWTFRKFFVDLTGISFNDTSVAIFGSSILFVLSSSIKGEGLLVWKDTEKLPWGILLLFGGGLALAASLESNGVIDYLSTYFDSFASWHYYLLLLVLISIAIFGTELMSNLALVTVFIPVIGSFSLHSEYSILQLCIPITLAASCAFMLPVGTPPNAIVFSSGRITIAQMAKVGFLLNVFALFLITTMAYFFIS
jgi:sodium-dependent dicarboxylate transporter 2/3/5